MEQPIFSIKTTREYVHHVYSHSFRALDIYFLESNALVHLHMVIFRHDSLNLVTLCDIGKPQCASYYGVLGRSSIVGDLRGSLISNIIFDGCPRALTIRITRKSSFFDVLPSHYISGSRF